MNFQPSPKEFRAYDQDNDMFWYWELGYIKGDFWHHCRTLKHPVTQWTGLKDKNGTKIFEGDIIEDLLGNWHLVQYESGSWKVFWDFGQDVSGSCTLDSLSLDRFKVIGNCFQNPELLEGR